MKESCHVPQGSRKLVLSLFRKTDRDDGISWDWHSEVEAALAKGYHPDQMIKAMEGMTKEHASEINEKGNMTLLRSWK